MNRIVITWLVHCMYFKKNKRVSFTIKINHVLPTLTLLTHFLHHKCHPRSLIIYNFINHILQQTTRRMACLTCCTSTGCRGSVRATLCVVIFLRILRGESLSPSLTCIDLPKVITHSSHGTCYDVVLLYALNLRNYARNAKVLTTILSPKKILVGPTP